MGFRNGAYATVWGVEPGKTDRYQQVRLSTSRKNKKTGQFEQDFSRLLSIHWQCQRGCKEVEGKRSHQNS